MRDSAQINGIPLHLDSREVIVTSLAKFSLKYAIQKIGLLVSLALAYRLQINTLGSNERYSGCADWFPLLLHMRLLSYYKGSRRSLTLSFIHGSGDVTPDDIYYSFIHQTAPLRRAQPTLIPFPLRHQQHSWYPLLSML